MEASKKDNEANNTFGEKDFDAFLKKWIHHDRLLNDRERYYLSFQAGMLGVLSYLVSKHPNESIVPLVTAPALIVITWVIYVYYKISQEVDYFYRNAFDKQMAAYTNKFATNRDPLSNDSEWATAFKKLNQDPPTKTAISKIVGLIEPIVEKVVFGTDLGFKHDNGHPALMRHRIQLMQIFAIIDTVVAVVVIVRRIDFEKFTSGLTDFVNQIMSCS